eukprot:gene8609-biopygen12148
MVHSLRRARTVKLLPCPAHLRRCRRRCRCRRRWRRRSAAAARHHSRHHRGRAPAAAGAGAPYGLPGEGKCLVEMDLGFPKGRGLSDHRLFSRSLQQDIYISCLRAGGGVDGAPWPSFAHLEPHKIPAILPWCTPPGAPQVCLSADPQMRQGSP